MTADLRRLVKKIVNTLVCIRAAKKLQKKHKNGMSIDIPFLCLRREGYISPLCSAYPPKPLVTPLCMWGPMGDIITLAQFQLNRFRG